MKPSKNAHSNYIIHIESWNPFVEYRCALLTFKWCKHQHLLGNATTICMKEVKSMANVHFELAHLEFTLPPPNF